MQYELQTRLGVVLDPETSLDEVRARLHSAIDSVSSAYGNVSAFRVVPGEGDSELIVGIRFHEGVRAEYVEETATEILDKATERLCQEATDPQHTEMNEESVRLQSVFA
jgi:hypothetical protein